jgi:hypothetical protein
VVAALALLLATQSSALAQDPGKAKGNGYPGPYPGSYGYPGYAYPGYCPYLTTPYYPTPQYVLPMYTGDPYYYPSLGYYRGPRWGGWGWRAMGTWGWPPIW